ncbi:MAG: hypothetical protein QNJ35_11745 [Paracoccaceae bacterium]|nr:hypothetical protein [Paracoccaceae bacterium]
MLATFILGVLAGFGAPYAEPRIKEALKSVLLADAPIEPLEMRGFSLALCLLGAAILSMIFGSPHAAPLALGAVVGVFGPRLMEKWKARKTPDYDS